jgi:hypothetical protein
MMRISGNMGRAICTSGWKMAIIEIDHDMFANRRNRWIGGSRVVSVPSNAKRCDTGRRSCDTDVGSSPRRRAKPIRDSREWQRVGRGGG